MGIDSTLLFLEFMAIYLFFSKTNGISVHLLKVLLFSCLSSFAQLFPYFIAIPLWVAVLLVFLTHTLMSKHFSFVVSLMAVSLTLLLFTIVNIIPTNKLVPLLLVSKMNVTTKSIQAACQFFSFLLSFLFCYFVFSKQHLVNRVDYVIHTLQSKNRKVRLSLALLLCFVVLFSIGWFGGSLMACLKKMTNPIFLLPLFLFISFMLFFDYSLYITKLKERQKLLNIELDGLKHYSLELEKSLVSLQGFRHDYLNIVSTLEYAIYEENMEEIKEIFQKIILPSRKVIMSSQSILIKLSPLPSELKALLTNKIIQILNEEVMVDLVITTTFEQTIIDSLDLIRILSILLDNALEEALEGTESTIQIILFEKDTSYEIEISNPLYSEIEAINTLTKKHYSTKKSHSGLGLYILSNLLEKYPMVNLTTKISANRFIQTVTIFSGEKH